MNMLKFDYVTRAVAATALGLTLAAQTAWAETKIRVQSVIPITADETVMLQDFAKDVSDLTDGSLQIEVLPAGAIVGVAETLDAESVNVIETFGKKAPTEQVVECFAGVCDRAAARGNWTVHLEFMPFSGIPDLATAWEIVRTANRSNGGVLLDTWHYYRGTPDHELLKTIPGNKVFRVQLADANKDLNGDLMNDLLHYRKLPGEGDFDLTTVLQILQDTGGLNSLGPEIFADQMDALSAEQATEQAITATRQVLAEANLS